MRRLLLILIIPAILLAGESDSSRTWRPNPALSAGLSVVLPGGGQIYNRSYWKAPIAMALEGYAAWTIYDAQIDIDDAIDVSEGFAEDDPVYLDSKSKWEDARERRNIHIWLMVGFVALSSIDAYVDAHLYPWTEEMAKPVETRQVMLYPTMSEKGSPGLQLAFTFKLP